MSKPVITKYNGKPVVVPAGLSLTTYKSRRNRGWSHEQAVGDADPPPSKNWLHGFFNSKDKTA